METLFFGCVGIMSSSLSGTSVVTVKDELIESVQFFVPRPLLFRWDTGPFFLYYAILFSIPLIQHINGKAFSYSFESNSSTTGTLRYYQYILLIHLHVHLFA